MSFLRPRAVAGELEVGAHLHPWTTPPFAEQPGLRQNDNVHAFPCELDPELLLAKLETLTAQVAEAAGARPTSFRAGRFGHERRRSRLAGRARLRGRFFGDAFVSWVDHDGRPGRAAAPTFAATTRARFASPAPARRASWSCR